MDYTYVLRRARQIVWSTRWLGLFGLLSSLGYLWWPWFDPRNLVAWMPAAMRQGVAEIVAGPHSVLAISAFILLGLVTYFLQSSLIAVGRAALAGQVNWIENGGAGRLRTGWETAKRRWGPVFLVRLLLSLPILLVTSAGLIPYGISALTISLAVDPAAARLAVGEALARFLACFVPAIVLGLLLSLPIALLQRLAVRACVLEGCSVRASIARGWQVLLGAPGPIAVLWITLTGISVGIVAVAAIPVCLFFVGSSASLFAALLSTPSVGLAVLCGASLASWLFAALVSGLGETFLSAAWTVAYRDLTGLGRTGEEVEQERGT